MICPQCKAEYRPGFTHCADCDVDLVWESSPDALASYETPEPGDPSQDPFCSFWKGDDPRIHAELCSVLDESGIPHNTIFRRDHLFNLNNYAAFEVGVPFSLYQKAELAIKDAFGTDEGEEDDDVLNVPALTPAGDFGSVRTIQKLPAQLTPPQNENNPGPTNAGDDAEWYEEDANVRVWADATEDLGDFLVAALHENGIRCRLQTTGAGPSLYVLPSDEMRAREIVREVVEGKPPE
jgi:hypothetical protein